MFLQGGFFGDVSWWVFPLVGIPMMLFMMVGMGFMMRMMMGMGGMGSHSASNGPDQASEAEVAPSGEEVADLRRQGPLDIAKERLAKGEIDKEEFDRIRGDLA